jgi:hypothetical protein
MAEYEIVANEKYVVRLDRVVRLDEEMESAIEAFKASCKALCEGIYVDENMVTGFQNIISLLHELVQAEFWLVNDIIEYGIGCSESLFPSVVKYVYRISQLFSSIEERLKLELLLDKEKVVINRNILQKLCNWLKYVLSKMQAYELPLSSWKDSFPYSLTLHSFSRGRYKISTFPGLLIRLNILLTVLEDKIFKLEREMVELQGRDAEVEKAKTVVAETQGKREEEPEPVKPAVMQAKVVETNSAVVAPTTRRKGPVQQIIAFFKTRVAVASKSAAGDSQIPRWHR